MFSKSSIKQFFTASIPPYCPKRQITKTALHLSHLQNRVPISNNKPDLLTVSNPQHIIKISLLNTMPLLIHLQQMPST